MPDNQNSSAIDASLRREVVTVRYTNTKPAPAMLNGVEGLVAKWEAEVEAISEQEESSPEDYAGFLAAKLDELEAALRAADNCDAAGVCSCPSGDGSLRWPCPQHGTPTAAPAGEAVAWMVSDLRDHVVQVRRLAAADRKHGGPVTAEFLAARLDAAANRVEAAIAAYQAHPPAAEVREAVWIACADRLPTEADADGIGDVVWRRSGVPILGSVASGKPIDATHWRRTGRAALSPPGRAEGEDRG